MILVVVLLWLCQSLLQPVGAMRSDYLAQLRQDTVDMFYHGYSNYMKHAFPEDEVGFMYRVRHIKIQVNRKLTSTLPISLASPNNMYSLDTGSS